MKLKKLATIALSIAVHVMWLEALAHSEVTAAAPLGWSSWTWSPLVLFNLALLAVLYAVGLRKIARKRGSLETVSNAQVVAYYLGEFCVFIALLSPVDAFSDVLGWVHMIQHTLLMMVAAPLFAFGSPGYVLLWAMPKGIWKDPLRLRSVLNGLLRLSRFSRPILVWALYAMTLWILHLPVLYEGALKSELLHDIQHLAFFGSAFLFWRITLDPFLRRKLVPEVAILYLFVASLHAMVLGVLMALSPQAWYSWYVETAPRYGFSAIEDQQIAGYIMWMPAGVSFVAVALLLLARSLKTQADKISNS